MTSKLDKIPGVRVAKKSGPKKQSFPKFTPPKTLAQEIKDYISQLIILERLPAGERLVPETLAKELNVSKSPVREALSMLVQEELLITKPRMGFFVAEVSLQDINEIYPIRATLNGLLVAAIIDSAYATDFIPTLDDLVAKMRISAQVGNSEDFFKYNVEYYDFLHTRCPNRHLTNIILQLGAKVLRFRYIVHTRKGHSENSLRLHEALTAAIKERDAKTASDIAGKIVLAGLEALRGYFATREKV